MEAEWLTGIETDGDSLWVVDSHSSVQEDNLIFLVDPDAEESTVIHTMEVHTTSLDYFDGRLYYGKRVSMG